MRKLFIGVVAVFTVCGFAAKVWAAGAPMVTISETTRDADGHPTSFALLFQNFDADKSYPLYLFCDAVDSGFVSTNDWAYCERLDDIAPGETSRVVAAPACLGRDYFFIRFAADYLHEVSIAADSYVQDGLEVMWDAINNVAFGVHDDMTNSWTDLTGHGFDWKLDLNHAEWTNDGLVLKGTGLVGTSTKGSSDLQRKVKTVEFVYENSDKRHGIIFCPALGRTFYLYTDTDGHVGYYEKMGQAVALDETCFYSVVYSGSGDAPTGVESCWLNGLEDPDDAMNNYWNMLEKLYLGGRNSVPDRLAKGTLRALRIYSDVLTDEQRAWNYTVDLMRFHHRGFVFSECVHDAPKWFYDATAMTITSESTGWRFGVTAFGRELTLVSRDASGATDPSTLDLTGPVVDADANSFTIVEIPYEFFNENATLKDITLPLTLKRIGGRAFRYCTSLERVGNFLPPKLKSLGTDAFSFCSKLASPLVMGDLCVGALTPDGINPGNYHFNECSKLPSAVLGKSFTTLEKRTFYRCTSLTNLVLRGAVTKIAENAVRECTALRNVEPFLPDSLTYLGTDAFSGCTALESSLSLALENRVTLDGNYHFYNCPSIPSVALGKTWEIPEYCFYNCTGVRTFFLPEEPIVQLPGSQRRWAFTGWTEYQSRWIMPKGSKVWADFAATSTVVTALSPEERRTYRSLFSDSYTCVGVIADRFAKQWLCKPRGSGMMVIVK